jgi:alpha-1,2-mannosyltransferase
MILLNKLTVALRDADWLNDERAVGYCRILSAMLAALSLAWVVMSKGGIDVTGKPLGTDFMSFWAASRLAFDGMTAAPWNIPAHHAAQTAVFGRDVGYAAFFYPPTFLLICWPLALLPYFPALLAWLAVTGAAYVRIVRAFAGDRLGVLPVLAFPAVFINAGHGQNGFLSAALLGGGALMLNSRPILAGLCLGSLVYKPHLGLVIPVALIAAHRWQVFTAAAASAVGTCALSYAAFGEPSWLAFLELTAMARQTLEQGIVGDAKMQSVFATIRLLGGSLTAAYALQVILAVGICAAIFQLQRRAYRCAAEGPVLVAAALLVSPFLLDYDLTLLAIPLAWCASEGLRTGFRPYEKTILLAGFVLPLFSRSVATSLGLPLAPLVLIAVFTIVWRRGLHVDSPEASHAAAAMRHPIAATPLINL